MNGVYVGRDDQGRAIYVSESTELWAPKRWTQSDQLFRWPPRVIRRAIPLAQRGGRRGRRAHLHILRAAARYGLRVTRS